MGKYYTVDTDLRLTTTNTGKICRVFLGCWPVCSDNVQLTPMTGVYGFKNLVVNKGDNPDVFNCSGTC
jgi:hypothetical protein